MLLTTTLNLPSVWNIVIKRRYHFLICICRVHHRSDLIGLRLQILRNLIIHSSFHSFDHTLVGLVNQITFDAAGR